MSEKSTTTTSVRDGLYRVDNQTRPSLYAEIDRLKADLAMSKQIIAEKVARDTDINEIKKQAFVAGVNWLWRSYLPSLGKTLPELASEAAEEYANGSK